MAKWDILRADPAKDPVLYRRLQLVFCRCIFYDPVL